MLTAHRTFASGDETMKELADGLSELQQEILLNVVAHDASVPEDRRPWYEGAPIRWLREEHARTRADSAAFSRAVARLVKRGLVFRVNGKFGITTGPHSGNRQTSPDDPPPRRATHVRVTEAGRAVARQLTPDEE